MTYAVYSIVSLSTMLRAARPVDERLIAAGRAADVFGRADADLPELAGQDLAGYEGTRIACRARHGCSVGGAVIRIEQIVGVTHLAGVLAPFQHYAHDREVLLAGVQLPLVEEQLGRHRQRAHGLALDVQWLGPKEAAFAQDGHQACMSWIAQRHFFHDRGRRRCA